MRESCLETKNHWPEVEVPKDLLSYFVSKQVSEYPDDKLHIPTRQHFLELLNEDPFFGEFWEQVYEVYPEKSEYFASLTDEQKPFEANWIKQEYYRSLYEIKWYEMPEDERSELQAEFKALQPRAYQAALKGEAMRLNCKISEVRPICPVLLSTTNGDEESMLTGLPDAALRNIINRLNTLDIFRITLVCKSWKRLIYDTPWHLTRAEHAKTTHLITFTEWMDPAKTPSCETFNILYEQFGWGLIKWCYGISEHLETVILDQEISYENVAELVQSCPNLKNLQIGYGRGPFHVNDGPFNDDVLLHKLEFYCSRMYNTNVHLEGELDLDTKLLLSCESLRYFGAPLVLAEISSIEIRDRMQHAFGKLVALDLQQFSFDVLEALADVDHLHLRYFGLGVLPSYFSSLLDDYTTTTTLRALLERILPKLMTLEMLTVGGVPGIGSSTIKLLTELQMNLKFAVFNESKVHRRLGNITHPDQKDNWEVEVLTDFGQMLLSNDPGLDLSEFYFIVAEDEIPHDLRETDSGFTIISQKNRQAREACDVGLCFQSIKRRLGIDF